MSLQERAMLVKLRIHQWGNTKQDSKKTEELAEANKTTKDWLRANKTLLPKEATKPLQSELGAAYNYHREVTLPWDDLGFRVLPVDLYGVYVKTINAHQEKVRTLAQELKAKLPDWKAKAKANLNGGYNEADYPADLPALYGIDMSVRPIPIGADLRIGIKSEELSKLRENINAEVLAQIKDSVNDLWLRLQERVAQAARGFKDGKVLFECWVSNIKELTDILPKLNITGDKELDAMTTQVRQKLAGLDINAIRADESVRDAAARTAAQTLKKIDAVIKRQGVRKIDFDI